MVFLITGFYTNIQATVSGWRKASTAQEQLTLRDGELDIGRARA